MTTVPSNKTQSDANLLYIFAYGSLMWDGWEDAFAGKRVGKAVLPGYRRSFCILDKSGRWGTPSRPGLVLGLIAQPNSAVEGTLFGFDRANRRDILQYLRAREGPHHPLVESIVTIQDSSGGSIPVRATFAVSNNDSDAFVGNRCADERLTLLATSSGTAGRGIDYICGVMKAMDALGIHDDEVVAFAKHMGV